jgi:hypothetical protein
MTKALPIALGLLVLPAVAVQAGTEAPAVTAALCASGASAAYPSFCDIPRTPTDVRSPKAFKASVVDLRRAGRRVVRATGPGTFGLPLGEADAFSRAAQAEAAPPPEVSAAPPENSEATAAELRRLAKPPPPRPR